MHRKGSLYTGVYQYTDDCWTTDQIINEMLLVRRHNHIGYYVSDSYRWYIGIVDQKPEVLQIACCKRSKNSHSLQPVFIQNIKVFVIGAIAPVTEDNYNILAFIHYISALTNDKVQDYPYLATYALQNDWSDSTFAPYMKDISRHGKRHLHAILKIMNKH